MAFVLVSSLFERHERTACIYTMISERSRRRERNHATCDGREKENRKTYGSNSLLARKGMFIASISRSSAHNSTAHIQITHYYKLYATMNVISKCQVPTVIFFMTSSCVLPGSPSRSFLVVHSGRGDLAVLLQQSSRGWCTSPGGTQLVIRLGGLTVKVPR